MDPEKAPKWVIFHFSFPTGRSLICWSSRLSICYRQYSRAIFWWPGSYSLVLKHKAPHLICMFPSEFTCWGPISSNIIVLPKELLCCLSMVGSLVWGLAGYMTGFLSISWPTFFHNSPPFFHYFGWCLHTINSSRPFIWGQFQGFYRQLSGAHFLGFKHRLVCVFSRALRGVLYRNNTTIPCKWGVFQAILQAIWKWGSTDVIKGRPLNLMVLPHCYCLFRAWCWSSTYHPRHYSQGSAPTYTYCFFSRAPARAIIYTGIFRAEGPEYALK